MAGEGRIARKAANVLKHRKRHAHAAKKEYEVPSSSDDDIGKVSWVVGWWAGG